ncbi:MAG: hypothetical protein Q4G19_00925 [Clostridia bacterium]|nr:hypothetical protein [Clostridia bacterium]
MKVISADAVKKIITAIFAVILALLAIIPCIATGANAEEEPRAVICRRSGLISIETEGSLPAAPEFGDVFEN